MHSNAFKPSAPGAALGLLPFMRTRLPGVAVADAYYKQARDGRGGAL